MGGGCQPAGPRCGWWNFSDRFSPCASPPIDLVTGGGYALVGPVGGRAGRGVAAVAAGCAAAADRSATCKRGPSVRAFVLQTGGVQFPPPRRAAGALMLAEREAISRGLAAGDSCRVIAQRLGRAPSTVSREVARNGGRRCYGAQTADAAADRRARRPKPAKLVLQPRLRAVVEDKLALRWSPQQIASRSSGPAGKDALRLGRRHSGGSPRTGHQTRRQEESADWDGNERKCVRPIEPESEGHGAGDGLGGPGLGRDRHGA